MPLLLLCLALLLSGRLDGSSSPPSAYDPARSGVDVGSWIRHSPDGRPDLWRTAVDIRHNNLLRGAAAGLGLALLMLALGRRFGWGDTPWMAEAIPGAAIHNGTKAIHLGVYAGLCALAVAAANAMGGDLERDESRLPEALLLAGECLAACGAVGMLARRLDKKRPNAVTRSVRKWFDRAAASPERPPAPSTAGAPSLRLPADFEPEPLLALATELWSRMHGAPDFPPADSPALSAGLYALFSLQRDIRAGIRKEHVPLKADVVLVRQDGPYRTATVRMAASPGTSRTARNTYWTFARRHPAAEDASSDWVLSAITSEDEWAPPDPLRLERLRPWLDGPALESPHRAWDDSGTERSHPSGSLVELEDAALRLFVERTRPLLGSGSGYPAVAAVDAMTVAVSEDGWIAQVVLVWEMRDGRTDSVIAGSQRRELLRLVIPADGQEHGPRHPLALAACELRGFDPSAEGAIFVQLREQKSGSRESS